MNFKVGDIIIHNEYFYIRYYGKVMPLVTNSKYKIWEIKTTPEGMVILHISDADALPIERTGKPMGMLWMPEAYFELASSPIPEDNYFA